MPTFVKSAMNPNGTWQQDGMDRSEMANRDYQTQMQGRDLQTQLALGQLHNQRYGMDQMADITRSGWDREDARHSSDLEKAIAVARIGKEMGEGERLRFERDGKFEDMMLAALNGGGQAAPQTTGVSPQQAPFVPRSTVPNAPAHGMTGDQRTQLSESNDVFSQLKGPGAMAAETPDMPQAQPQVGSGGRQDPLRQLAIMSALRNKQAIPDFATQDMNHELMNLNVNKMHREEGRRGIEAALQAGDLETAKRISAETGEPMPRTDVNQLVTQPAIAGGIENLMEEGKRVAGRSYFGEDDPAGDSQMDELVNAATTQLINRGADPADARAFVIAKLREKFGKGKGIGLIGSVAPLFGGMDGGGIGIDGVYNQGADVMAKYAKDLR